MIKPNELLQTSIMDIVPKYENVFDYSPGYATPLEAMKGPREELLYVVCVQPNHSEGKSDLLATIDVDPKSSTYCKIIHRLHTGNPTDELHHSGWNTCSSCHTTKGCHAQPKRDTLVLPSITSNRIYFVNTGLNPKAPTISKVIEPSKMTDLNCAYPHTTHCLATGEIMISVLGDKNGNAKGDFVLIDGKTLEITGTWTNGKLAKYGYDFWYQPYFDVMVASEWAVPNVFKNGFIPNDALNPDIYGTSLNFYSWKSRELIQTIDLGIDGVAPLEIRFLHNPKESQGYVGCCLNSNIYRFYLDDGTWKAEKVISVKPKKVSGWISDYIQGTISDILISLDDKYLYFSNWVHGDVRQYDISDRKNPKLTGQVFLGGKIVSDSKIKVLEDPELDFVPDPVYIKGKRLYGAPQMLQLSLDGKRLYVSSSLFSPWDRQFYPESIEHGSFLVKLDVDVKNGGMKLDENFYVDFETGPDGPLLAHEMRYPGGDCTSDIWMVDESK